MKISLLNNGKIFYETSKSFNINTIIQSSSKMYKLLVLIISFLMLITSFNNCKGEKNNNNIQIIENNINNKN